MYQEIEFSHTFQPIVDIDQKRVVSYEVLLPGVLSQMRRAHHRNA